MSARALPRLVTIPISHYGERARWALDHAGVDYDEEHHVQFFSWLAALRLGGKRTLPVLVTEDGVLTDSADIVRWADARGGAPLFPNDPARRDEIERFERELCDDYGVETRRLAYRAFFGALDACLPYNAGRAPRAEVKLLAIARRPMIRFVKAYFGIEPKKLDRARAVVLRTMDDVARRLADGRPYLFGDCFSAADLAFATMTAPSVRPDRYGVELPPLDLLSVDSARTIAELRAHPAGAFALRLYDERPAPRGRHQRPAERD